MDDTVYLDAPVNDPDIDDVPSSAEFPGMSPSSTLGLSTTLPNSPSSNNSNPITPSIPPVSSVPSIGPPPGLALPSSTLGLSVPPAISIPPPPGFPIQVNDVFYFPMWVAMTWSVPKSGNIGDLALYQSANMNFNNLQHLSLAKPNVPSVSEARCGFKLKAPFVLDKESLPPTQEVTVDELDSIPELAAADACAFLLSIIPRYRDWKLQSSNTVDVGFLKT